MRRTHLLIQLGGILASDGVLGYDEEVWGDEGTGGGSWARSAPTPTSCGCGRVTPASRCRVRSPTPRPASPERPPTGSDSDG